MYEKILDEMMKSYEQATGIQSKSATDIHIRFQTLAGELAKLYNHIGELEKQIVPQTSSGKHLEFHGEMRGISRKKGVPANGNLVFSRPLPAPTDIVIPVGTLASTNSVPEIYFQTMVERVLKQGDTSVYVPSAAIEQGIQGNVSAKQIQVLISTPAGISKVTNEIGFRSGRDEENEDDYRKRIVACYQNSSTGNNKKFYYQYAIGHPNVRKAKVIPKPNESNMAVIVISCHSKANEEHTLSSLSQELGVEKAIGVRTQVILAKDKPLSFNIKLSLTDGQNFEKIKEDCEESLSQHMEQLEIGQSLLLSHIGAVLLSVKGVDNYQFVSPTTDLFPQEEEVYVLDSCEFYL